MGFNALIAARSGASATTGVPSSSTAWDGATGRDGRSPNCLETKDSEPSLPRSPPGSLSAWASRSACWGEAPALSTV